MKRLASRNNSSEWLRFCSCLCALLASLLLGSLRAHAQEAQFTQNSGGSHAVTIDVPLANYPGRGVSMPVKLSYSSSNVWRIGFVNTVSLPQNVRRSVTEAIYSEHATAGWTTSLDVPEIEWPRQSDVFWYTGKAYTFGTVPPYTFRIAQLFVHMPDGSTHEMRKADAVYADNGVIDMTGTFYSVDSSRMRYESNGQTSGILYLADGSRYLLGGSTVQYIDRNGNTLNYDVANRQWTDTLGRVIGMPFPVNPGPGDYTYSLPAFNNSTVTYTLKFRSLSNALTPDAQGQTPALKLVADYYLPNPNALPSAQGGSNFPQTNSGSTLFFSGYTDPEESVNSYVYMLGKGQSGGSLFNPTVLTEIVYPNGQKYKFSYNVYGELDKMVFPAGGYERYQYSTVSPVSGMSPPYGQGSRGMTSRTVSANGTGSDEVQWQYSTSNWPMTITAPDGTVTETYLFLPSDFTNNFGYKDARAGMVVEQRVYAPAAAGGAMLRRTLMDYAQSSVTLNKPVPPNTFNTGTYTAYRNARPTKAVSLVLDTGGSALVKTTTFEYAANGSEFSTGLDQTASNDYHFATVDQATAQSGTITSLPLGALHSRAEVVFVNSSAYTTRNILGLPSSIVIKDASLQTVSRADSFYDETAYPLLTYSDLTASTYTDPGNTTVRGNVTTSRFYTDIGLNLYLDTHTQFDQCGNVRSRRNERNIDSLTEYSADYKHAFPTQLTTATPDPSGAHGSAAPFTALSTFDYTTGLKLSATDENGQTTSLSYQDDLGTNDPLNRLRKITRPDGGTTKFSFGDTVGNLFTLVEVKQDATRTVQTYQFLDPLGRVSRTFVTDDGTNYIATDTIYDQQGREWKTSNPYRTSTLNGVADLSHTSYWTVRAYDSLQRIVSLTMPDGAAVQTSFQGVYTTITDEAGRQRRQKVDAFGQLVRVDEPNSSGSLGAVDTPTQATYYDYNVRGNLVHVTQGSGAQTQHRYFKYDAIGRLTYERQAEQVAIFSLSDPLTGNSLWTRKLIYDETINSVTYSGLLTSSYDARNIQAQFRYDNLNRVYQLTYSDSTPAVTNNYDQARGTYQNKGKLTEALTAAVASVPATAQRYDFDVMGRLANQQQAVGTETYSIVYAYNLAGALTSQTYPSGRVVSYGYDNAARLLQVSSGATTYAGQYDYTSPTGQLKSVTLGNGAVENYVYNSRLQIQSIDLAKDGIGIQHYDYKYGAYNPSTNTIDPSKNSGQIAEIEGFIGTQKQWQQRFAYDAIGRLSSAREFRGDNGVQSYLANYEYDVFGNRYQKQGQNSGNPFTQKWVEAGDFDQTTNRFNSGVTYDGAGNVTVDSRFRNLKFQYDANNRQKQSTNLDDTGAVVSIFDATGQRVATQVSGSLVNVFVYDATGKLLAEYNSSTVSGGTQYVFNDHQNSPRVTTNGSGGVVARHDYLPFGEDLGAVGLRATTPGYGNADASRKKYAGMERNETTGMAHTLWRQYDSLSARWTSPDPYSRSAELANPQTLNRYTYVSNDPVDLIDPSGQMGKLPDASTSWSDVADGFWGWGNLIDRPRSIGRQIIAARMARQDRLIKGRIDGKLLAYYLKKGKYEAAKRLLESNPDIGLLQNGRKLWGGLGAAFVEGVASGIPQAGLASASPQMQGVETVLQYLAKLGWEAVVKRLKKARRPDFAVLNVNIVAGITRFIPQGDDMSKALQGVSAGAGEGQISWAVGWLLQLEAPTHDEIVEWGKGLSFNADIFVIGGGGFMRSMSSDTEAVYMGLGIGGGPGASYQYKVW